MLSLGGLWWLMQESRTQDKSSALSATPPPRTAPPVVASTAVAPSAAPKSPALPAAPIDAFKTWAVRYAQADAASRAAMLGEGLGLAQQRKSQMLKMIEAHPQAAIQQALPYAVRRELPAAFDSLVEKVVSGQGDLNVLGSTGRPSEAQPTSPIQRWVSLNGEKYRAFVYGSRLQGVTQKGTPLWGVALGGTVAVSDDVGRLLSQEESIDLQAKGVKLNDPVCGVSGIRSTDDRQSLWFAVGARLSGICSAAHASVLNDRFRLASVNRLLPSDPGGSNPTNTEPGRAVSVTQGRLRVLFMRVAFQDNVVEPISADDLTKIMTDVNDYYRTASYNYVQMIPTVTPLLILPNVEAFYTIKGPDALLADARIVSAEAGYSTEDYDLDVVGHATLSGEAWNWGGLAFVGARGAWIQAFTPKVISHELGHNLGLLHANASDTKKAPGPVQPNPPLPIDPDSDFGHHAVNAHGRFVDDAASMLYDVEYGDPYDWMGSGDAITEQFNSLHKVRLRWMPMDKVAQLTASSTNRLYAFDSSSLDNGKTYAISVRKELGRKGYNRAYWIDHRQLLPGNPWLSSGVELYWTPWEGTKGSSQLIDTTPESSKGLQDAALLIGRTFDDREADIHITPTRKGRDGGTEWIDVVVQVGPFPGNRPPTFNLEASSVFVSPGQRVDFTAADVTDADGDPVVYSWSYSDDTFGPNAASVSRTFAQTGHYVVRCEVSDMKGGKISRHVLVTVGSPSTVTVGGVVRDENGDPVEGARVAVVGGAEDRIALTDTDGTFTLVGVNGGFRENIAFHYGYETQPKNFQNPAPIFEGGGFALEYLAASYPLVSVQALGAADESRPTGDAKFRFTRKGGDLLSDLPVYFQLVGSAEAGKDYTVPSNGMVIFTAGLDTIDVPLTVKDDKDSEGRETAIVQLVLATNVERYINYVTNIVSTNVDAGVTNTTTNTFVYIATNSWSVPGWEIKTVNGVLTWFQTHPPYVLGNDTAVLPIGDNEQPGKSSFSLAVFDETALEGGLDEAVVLVSRTGNPDQAADIRLSFGGVASNGVDYALLPSTLHFDVGQSSAAIFVKAIDDLFVEGDETLTITIDPSPSYDVTGDPATLVIVDNDLPLITVNTVVSQGMESDPVAARFTISRAGDLSTDLQVNYLMGGTATNGVDYNRLGGTATIPAGKDSVDVVIIPVKDGILEAPESIQLQISSSTYYNVGVPGAGNAVLYDETTPVVTMFGSQTAPLREGGTGFTLTFQRTGPTLKPLTVNLAFSGDADRFSDYGVIGNQVTIPAGSSQYVLSLTPANDTLFEVNESFRIRLQPGDGYLVSQPNEFGSEIADDDQGPLPSFSFVTAASSVPEKYPGGTYEIPVEISRTVEISPIPVVVEYRVVGGSAIVGTNFNFTDYPLLSKGYLIYTNAWPTVPLTLHVYDFLKVDILDDDLAGKDKTLVIGLSYPSTFIFTNITQATNDKGSVDVTNYVVAPTNFNLGPVRFHTITIKDDDYNVVGVEATTPFAYEDGQNPGTFTFTRTGPVDKDVTVEFAVTGSASPNTDYVPLPRSIVIPAGLDSVTLDVIPIEDQTAEIAESVKVTLSRAVGSKLDPAKTRASVLIVDNDGTIEFTQSTYSVKEDVGTFQIPVRRFGLVSLAQSVDYSITGGTATPGVDYVAPAKGTLFFAPGETLKNISLVVSNDLLVEADESIELTLENASGGTPLSGQKSTTVVINSDDTEFRFSTNHYYFSERTNSAPIVIQRVGPASGPASVTLVVTNGSLVASNGFAVDGADFRATNRVINFADGVSNVTFLVRINDDFDLEGNELVALSLTNASPGILLGRDAASVLEIQDDDCRIEFAADSIRVNEFDGVALVDVRRTGGVLNTVLVDFRTADGTAIAGQDFVRTNGTLTFLSNRNVQDTNGSGSLVFLPGQSNLTLRILLLDDVIGEGEETFNVRLSNARLFGGGAASKSVGLGNRTNLLVAIRDDETAGSVDYQVAAGLLIDGTVRTLSLQADDRLVLGGDFTQVNGFAIPQIARLTPNGDLDTGFNPGVGGGGGSVLSVASEVSGKVLLGGDFSQIDGVPRASIARIDQDGDLDATFDVGTGALGIVRAVAVQADGKVIIGGDFLRYNSVNRTRLARINPDGRMDTNFTAVVNASVNAVLIQPDGRILIGGSFTRVNNANVQGVMRLNPDGSIDNTFKVEAGLAGTVYALALQTNGDVVVGGDLSSFNGQAVANLIRLSKGGALDPAFGQGAAPNGIVRALGVSSAGKIYAGGEFTAFGSTARSRVARLRVNGLVDDVFDPGTGANGTVRSLVVHSNSEVSIAGDFTQVNGIPRSHVARLHGDERLAVTGVEFDQASYIVNENVGAASVTLRRVGDPKVAFTVTVSTVASNSTATAGDDYVATTNLLNFGAGVMTRTFDVSIIDDAAIESEEVVKLAITQVSPGVDLSGLVTADLLVEDNEVSVQLTSAALTANENDGSVSIGISRLGLTNATASVTLSTVAGTADAGTDFVALSQVVTFLPGERSKTVNVSLVNDTLREPAETFKVRLDNASEGVLLGLSEAVVTVLDTDREVIDVVATALITDPNHNGGIDPGEVVTLMVALINNGTADASGVTAIPVASPGIVLDAGLVQLQNFGNLNVGGSPSSRKFTFGNNAQQGASLELFLQLTDSSDRDLGIVKVPVALGPQSRVFSSATAMNINDNGKADPYPSVINVAGLPGAITKVSLTLMGFTHPSPADVDILLVSPDGANSIVFSDVGGINAVEGLNITLDDSAANDLPVLLPLTSGTFRPRNSKLEDVFPAPAPVAPYRNSTLDFKGRDPNGLWSLYVVDDTAQWAGALRGGWKIAISTSGLLVPAADVGVGLTSDSAVGHTGQDLTYTLRAVNNGPATASNVVVRLTLPAGATLISAPAGASNEENQLSWGAGDLVVGQERLFTVIVKPGSGESLTSVASVATDSHDIFSPNNSATLTVRVTASTAPKLEISTADGKVLISWPANATGMVLQSATSFSANGTAVWSDVSGSTSTEGGKKTLRLNPEAGERFYRLLLKP